MKKVLVSVAAAATLLASGAAQAQSWGYPQSNWGQPAWRGGYDRGWNRGYDGRAQQVCNGQRGNQLQSQLRHEWNEGEIDPRTAQRIDNDLYKLQRKSYEECSERDWNAVRKIAQKYDEIAWRIDREAHSDWNRDRHW